jgi:GT2 family glycosyltransferase
VSAVAAVVGNFEGAELLPDCLASLRRQTHPPEEVVVVDAASRDASVEVARLLGARVIRTENRGLGALYNAGVHATGAGYVLLANNDVAFEDGCVAALASALDEDASRFAADARQLDWSGTRLVHGHTRLTRGRLTGEYLPGLHLDHLAEVESTRPTVCANGAAMLVRRERMLELGGFDETFFMEWEDLDLCWRAWLRGWATVYVPAATVRHRVGAVTTADMLPRRSASSHHNLVRFALKCLPWRAAARVVAGELARLPRHPRAVASGLAAVAVELPQILRLRRRLGPKDETLARLLDGAAA